jgi:hypothetical protein
MRAADIDRWRNMHRFCNDEPGEIVGLDEARFVLNEHGGHGPTCRQFLCALSRTSEVTQ